MLIPTCTVTPLQHFLQNSPMTVMGKLAESVDKVPLISAVLQQELHSSVTKGNLKYAHSMYAVLVVEPSKNRYGRPYISGRPLLTCDRKQIVSLFEGGMKKINIAKRLGITHSCVSKVLRR